MVVLDEADEMLDLGFAEDLETLLSSIKDGTQTALFSATLAPTSLCRPPFRPSSRTPPWPCTIAFGRPVVPDEKSTTSGWSNGTGR